ncbi:MAG: nucleotidyltransferase [Candidatus Sabulitectum sp.]|nr:nucleotidyltransferase [Candidatus Sabulitectum sp.]
MNSEFKELLKLFEKYRVRYLIVGGYAVMKYSEPRFTKDIDFWIAVDSDNARAVFAALKDFGAPLTELSAEDFTDRESFYQMGRPPVRVDIMMSIPGGDFEEAWLNREEIEIDSVKLLFISRSDLIKTKKASGRPQDMIDVLTLDETKEPEH